MYIKGVNKECESTPYVVLGRRMDRIEHLKELFQPVFERNSVILYDVLFLGILYDLVFRTNGSERTLEVSIMKEDGSMDLDTCALVSEQISEILDQEDPIKEEYTLEVCSPGAEREIKNLDEIKQGMYVYVRLKHPFKKMLEFTGEILDVNENIVHLSYRDKAAVRKAEFTKEDIDFIRLAVKF